MEKGWLVGRRGRSRSVATYRGVKVWRDGLGSRI